MRNTHFGVIGEPDSGGVLHRDPRAGQDGLALGEQEGCAVSLGFDPQQGVGVRTGRVLDGDPFRTRLKGNGQRASDERAVLSKGKVGFLPIHGHPRDGQAMRVEDDALGLIGRFDVIGGGAVDGPRLEVH